MPQVQLLAQAAVLALLVCAGGLVALQLLPTGVHPLRDPLSRYSGGRYGNVYDWQAFAAGVAAGGLVGAFWLLRLKLPLWGSAGLAAYALASALASAFPPHLHPPSTRRGRFNLLLAWLAVVG